MILILINPTCDYIGNSMRYHTQFRSTTRVHRSLYQLRASVYNMTAKTIYGPPWPFLRLWTANVLPTSSSQSPRQSGTLGTICSPILHVWGQPRSALSWCYCAAGSSQVCMQLLIAFKLADASTSSWRSCKSSHSPIYAFVVRGLLLAVYQHSGNFPNHRWETLL